MGWYSNSTQQYGDDISIEVAILQQKVRLPKLPKEKLSIATLIQYEEEGRDYKLAIDAYDDVIGNFYIPILSPMVDNTSSTELEFDAPKNSSVLNKSIEGTGYVERNFINLIIPKYIVLQFRDIIPKGTKFLVGFVGGCIDLTNMGIIGICSSSIDVAAEPIELADGDPVSPGISIEEAKYLNESGVMSDKDYKAFTTAVEEKKTAYEEALAAELEKEALEDAQEEL